MIEEIYVAFGIVSVLLLLFSKKTRVWEQPPSSDSEMEMVLQVEPRIPFEVDPMEIVSDSSENFELKEKWY